MASFKCKMCESSLDIADGTTVCECGHCGTKQTLPKSSDDQRLNMINRANHFRQQCEFDKAMEIYERILRKDDSDPEIYWSIVLCRYGIEYVDDPLTGRKIPACHRAQYTPITQDPYYLEALSHADELQKEVFRSEAENIARVQKGILEISDRAEPSDIFICCKEKDSGGKRTRDSVLAQEIYHQLTQEGFRVFFSRITLEDKPDSNHEPYIFAALNSAKAMVVVGTKPEYFNDVWVRNEWSRYLTLMKEDRSKILIPAYKDMDPYDLPEALSVFQSQDMSGLGFMQDLIRGIKKTAGDNSAKSAGTEPASGSKADNLVKRGFLSLEDGDMQKAAGYFEQALNENAEEARAYEGLLLVELNLRSESELENLDNPFDQNNNYKKAVRFADDKLREKLNGYIATIRNRSMDKTYYAAKKQLDSARTSEDIKSAAEKLISIKSWRDASDILYDAADKLSEENIADSLELAVSILTQISDYKDAAQKIDSIKEALSDIEARKIEREKAEHEKWLIRRKKRIIGVSAGLACAVGLTVAGCLSFYFGSYLPSKKYDNAMSLFNEGAYEEAAAAFSELGEYNDSGKLVDMCVKLNNERIKAASKIECNIGDIITVGKYEQDNDLSNGTEPIEWQVLDIRDGKALLISKYILDFQDIGGYLDGQWAYCPMNTWLNNDFYNAAFLDIEKNRIPETLVTASGDPNNRATNDAVVDTQDKIFLLSMSEAKKYFPGGTEESSYYSSDSLIATATEYATNKANYPSNVKYDWWLRTFIEWRGLNGTTYNAGCVNSIGIISESSPRALYVGVRPAMWYVLDPEANSDYPEANAGSEGFSVNEANIGDIITFGSYEQDDNFSNGADPIEWIVLENNWDSVKVISRYILDAVPYHINDESVQWGNCSIYDWLNGDFYNAAFSDEEKAKIKATGDYVPDNLQKVWSNVSLLKLDDILAYYGGETYYNENEEYYQSERLVAECTPYALSHKCDNGYWWLEDIGMSQWGYSAIAVRGSIVADTGIQQYNYGARPVINIFKS